MDDVADGLAPGRSLVRAATISLFVVGTIVAGALGISTAGVAGLDAAERLAVPPPGELIDVGSGVRIHLRVWGAEQSGPTIVLDASAGYFSSEWSWVAQRLARFNRVVAYDRPGMGWSTAGGQPRDARSAAEALSLALDIARIEPPFVVVGHSFGGLSARVFSALRRDDVIGLALLDTTHPDGGGGEQFARYFGQRAALAAVGAYRLLGSGEDYRSLPAGEATAARFAGAWRTSSNTVAAEMAAFDASAAQARDAGSMGELPLLVVCGPGSDEHAALQRDLTGLSTRSEFVRLDGVGHIQMLTDEAQSERLTMLLAQFLERIGARRVET